MICLECQNHVDECTCGDNGYLDQGDFLSLLQDFSKLAEQVIVVSFMKEYIKR